MGINNFIKHRNRTQNSVEVSQGERMDLKGRSSGGAVLELSFCG